jgi:hypothetical protein
MIIDHVGGYFFPEITELRVIGRYSMPIFGFFVGYNFKNSINFSILLYGSILYIISAVFIWHNFIQANILILLFLGQVYLFYFQNHFKTLTEGWLHFIMLVTFFPFTVYFFDYGSLIIGIIVMGYMVKIKSVNINIAACSIAFVSLFHTAVAFSNFNNIDFFLSFLVVIALWLSIAHSQFETEIPFNVKMISRHSMLIYFIHVLIAQFVWRYYVY